MNELARRQLLQLAATTVTLPAVLRFAGTQSYPTRPARLVVDFATAYAIRLGGIIG